MTRWVPAALVAIGLAAPLAAPAGAQGMDRAEVEQIVREYLLENPEVIMEALTILQARQEAAQAEQQQQALADYRDELFNHPESPVAGNPDGNVTVVEFFDYQCGYCKQVHADVRSLLEQDGNVRLVFKEFPILGPASLTATRAALAAREQDLYLPFHDALMTHHSRLDDDTVMRIAASVGLDVERLARDMEAPEIDALIARNHELAQVLGIRGTPAFVIGDNLIPGAVELDRLQELVEEARQG